MIEGTAEGGRRARHEGGEAEIRVQDLRCVRRHPLPFRSPIIPPSPLPPQSTHPPPCSPSSAPTQWRHPLLFSSPINPPSLLPPVTSLPPNGHPPHIPSPCFCLSSMQRLNHFAYLICLKPLSSSREWLGCWNLGMVTEEEPTRLGDAPSMGDAPCMGDEPSMPRLR